MKDMNPYESFVSGIADLVERARRAPLGGFPDYARPAPAQDAPVALIFSPHPDDEVIIGGWALRLRRQKGWRVINVAVTQGSNRERQQARWQELANCCRCIGFELQATQPNGLEGVNARTRAGDAARWREMVDIVAGLLARHQPRAIFFPHEADWNSTHIGTHHLVADALATLPAAFRCAAVETEFWGQMPRPNVLVESPKDDLAALITALTWHVGEVRRNPYHLTLPAWMMDNVRRGGEWIGGQGQAAPQFLFGTLYRLRTWSDGRFEDRAVPHGFLDAGQDPAEGF
jgi:LmbE family N-acetylglucosaminyl deacetylase